MGFSRFVEVGRVALINYGPNQGKLVVIIETVDSGRVLVDGPCTGVSRQILNTKRISLTDIVITGLHRNAKEKKIVAAWEAQGVVAAWEATAWAKKIARRNTRKNLNDFDRFQVMVAKKEKSKIMKELKA